MKSEVKVYSEPESRRQEFGLEQKLPEINLVLTNTDSLMDVLAGGSTDAVEERNRTLRKMRVGQSTLKESWFSSDICNNAVMDEKDMVEEEAQEELQEIEFEFIYPDKEITKVDSYKQEEECDNQSKLCLQSTDTDNQAQGEIFDSHTSSHISEQVASKEQFSQMLPDTEFRVDNVPTEDSKNLSDITVDKSVDNRHNPSKTIMPPEVLMQGQ